MEIIGKHLQKADIRRVAINVDPDIAESLSILSITKDFYY